MKTLYIFLLILLSYILISCDTILDVDVPENQIAEFEVFQNEQTAEAALANLYANLRDTSPIAGTSAGTILSIYTDDLDYFPTTSNLGYTELYSLQLIPSNPAVYTFWSNSYKNIYNANAIIEGVNNSTTLKPEVKNRMIGEALTIRSLMFWYLSQMFGDISLTLTTDYNINKNMGKTSYDLVLQQLEIDLTEAINKLPNDYRNSERIFINKKTAQLILAKVLMNQQKFDKAEILLKEITLSPLYTFQNNINNVFNKSSSHILWQLKPKAAGNATAEASYYYFEGAAPSNVALSLSLVSSFDVTDARRTNWITEVIVGSNVWYRASKYKIRSNNSTEYSIVFRLEEAYLLLAESLAQQNKILEALPWINATRTRANLPALTASINKNQLLTEIIQENRKEFFTEMGNRFFTLKRNNALSDLISSKSNWQTFHQLWPIPEKDLLLNPNLNPQNNGY